ncbi:MAG: hypothetical protein BroJett011_59690 [Chloroflexota bacterium]|nr:MAG: hypothetical protein BroJett011_59690 [Chloroflexota bacterium]
MSCNKNGQRCTNAALRNGIFGWSSQYLNILGSWSTWKDVKSIEDIPERIAQLTATMLGIKGLIEGHPYIAGAMGILIASQVLEKASAGFVTTGARLFLRGEPLVLYRGILIRKSPIEPHTTKFWNAVTGGNVLASRGYYFFEGGHTWHCQSVTVQVGDTPKTMTQVRSYSIPYREFYFDRPVYIPGVDPDPEEGERTISIQRVVDTVMADENPDLIPGFIGYTNPLENLTVLGHGKRLLFFANWLTVDEGERDVGRGDFVDYEALIKGVAPGSSTQPSGGDYYVVKKSNGSAGNNAGLPQMKPLVNLNAYTTPAYATSTPPSSQPYGINLFSSAATKPPKQLSSIPYKYVDEDQKEHPLIIKRVTKQLNGGYRADAIYYDEGIQRWREVTDDEDKEAIAQKVITGEWQKTPESEWPGNQTYI